MKMSRPVNSPPKRSGDRLRIGPILTPSQNWTFTNGGADHAPLVECVNPP